jgi:hypothetical protein
VLLGLGMFGIVFGALLLVLTRQNRLPDGAGSGLFIYTGGLFIVMAGVFVMEYVFPNQQHSAIFYQVCALTFPFRLIAVGRAGKTSWPVTRVAFIYLFIVCLMIWILPLFPAQPRLAPIFNPVTHMVVPPFPVLLTFPALAMDLILQKTGDSRGWKRLGTALILAAVFLAIFIPVQWCFSGFLISPGADNWFFGGHRVWGYSNQVGHWTHEFWNVETFNLRSLAYCFAFATGTSWLGLLLGGWMRKVQR